MPSLKIIMIGVWFGLLALGERLAPAARRPVGGTRLLRNVGLWAANSLMNPFMTVPIAVSAAALDLWTRPEMPIWAELALDLLMLDLWTYVWHRANHERRFLWRFHRVHHLDQFLDTSTAVRFHPGEVLISALARTPLIVAADIELTALLVFDSLVLAGALFHHSNLRLPPSFEAALRLLIVTPSHHWVHHHARHADTNSNYGTVLTVWDRVFRSWSPTARSPEMAIGVEEADDQSLASLAVAPFRPLAGPASEA